MTTQTLTNPVPGTWMQPPDMSIPPVYIPHELEVKKNEDGQEVKRLVPSQHVKRLILEGGMMVNGPHDATAKQHARSLEEALAEKDALLEAQARELAEMRAARAAWEASKPGAVQENKPKASR